MAQSFKPATKTITALEFGAYPVGRGPGWLMLDLRPDDDGAPADVVLARCWIYIKEPVNLSGQQMVFDIPDTKVKAEASYWMVYNEFPDKDGPITEVARNSSSTFKNGASWLSDSRQPRSDVTLIFRVISSNGPVPLLERADEELIKSRPKSKQDWTARGFQRSQQKQGHAPFEGALLDLLLGNDPFAD